MPESRKNIKSRMLRTVAKSWDYPGAENEDAFDPLVGLLINACAAELAKIDREKKLSQSRLTQEVARLLIPEADTRAAPAHAIATAKLLNGKGWIDNTENLVISKKRSDKISSDTLFCPTDKFPLIDAEVKFQASGNNISKIIDHKYKNILGYTNTDTTLPPATLYLGLEISDKLQSVDQISFFFNLLNAERKDFFLDQLKSSSWFLGDNRIEKKPGYPPSVTINENLDDLLTKRYQAYDRACREINRFYEQQFLTLQNVTGLSDARSQMPPELTTAFDSDALDEVKDHLVWIKVEFPQVVAAELLDDVFCFSNCFPILNRRKHESMNKLEDALNIIPLKSSDFFLDIKTIFDSGSKNYHTYNTAGLQGEKANNILLRTSGVGRFGAFEAKEELHYLLETLKDETASYAAVGTETIESIVSSINVLMGDLENKVSSMRTRETISYLVIRNLEDVDSLFIEFWSTAGARVNNISAGTKLKETGHSSIQSQGSKLVTPTVGGKNRLSEQEKVASFKRTLLANDRLVTKEDIKAFCLERLGSHITKVDIKKGLAHGVGNNKGLTRTINIMLTSNSAVATSEKEWTYLINDLLTKVRARVAHTLPYRVLLDQKVLKNQTRQFQ